MKKLVLKRVLEGLLLGACLYSAPAAGAQTEVPAAIDARLFRYPDVSSTHIVFVYAGDIWIVPKTGGVAQRLSSPRGEEMFPRFSPDGSRVAFSANYDGNLDIYVMPIGGGVPQRITHHGEADRLVDWYPDGRDLLYATMMTSQKDRFNQLYRIGSSGGLPEQLPVPYGEFGSISGDGKTLAYTPISVDFRTWKRYRGGMAPDIWLFDLSSGTARNLTEDDANDAQPMWHKDRLYFLSDRDEHQRANLWVYEVPKKRFRQVTYFKDFDVHFPSIGPANIVFENGGRLYLLDLENDQYREISIKVATDRATLKPRLENVSGYIHSAGVSPSGKRAVFSARGEIYTVPAENGVVRNLTQSPGVAERFPAWSPDGTNVAFFSDRTGEYELTLRAADGSGEETVATSLGAGFRYPPVWSPDSKKLVFIDQAMGIHLHDRETRQTRSIDRQLWMYHGELNGFSFNWSADSRWLAYAADQTNRNSAIVLYDTLEKRRYQVTSGYYNDEEPVFDPDNKYLYYRSGRTFAPIYSDLDNTWIYANTQNLIAVPLRKDVPSPLAPRNDEELEKKDKPDSKDKQDSAKDKDASGESKQGKESKDGEKKDADAEKGAGKTDPPKTLEIDREGFEARGVVLTPKPGRYADLAAVKGKLIYRRLPRTGSDEDRSPLLFYDLEKREEKAILDNVQFAQLAAKGEKMLVRQSGDYAIIEPKEGQKMDKKLNTGGLEALINPMAEWRQMFTDAWRLERDYFYDPGLHQVDWKAMRERYGAMLEDAVTRWDVNYLLGELIAELNASHTYRSGGATESAPQRGVGYLGVDFSLDNGAYRIKRILEAAPWDNSVRSPLREPGIDVKEGDYILAVNGMALDTALDPWAAFQGMANETIQLLVNDKPVREGAREVLVKTLSSEARLRHLSWIEANRKRVEEASCGKVGYVYVPDTGQGGQTELVRQFRAQFTKAALVIDERFNSGGQIPDRFIELLNRPLLNYWGVRDGRDWPWPSVAHQGPKVMLINGWSGSGGDAFPYYFKKAKLGPLIGSRTWGGLIGMTGAPQLIDNGSVTVPTFGIYSTQGEWIIEGYGVDPDIPVVDDPAQMAKGSDPQLERAIDETLRLLKKDPPPQISKPRYPNRATKPTGK